MASEPVGDRSLTASIDGSFGLVKLSSRVTYPGNVPGSSIRFLIDGKSTGLWAQHNHLQTESSDGYYTLFDLTALSNGAHELIAELVTTDTVRSAPLTFQVDAAEGMEETEPNDSLATATAVPDAISLIAGHLPSVKLSGTSSWHADADYYRIRLAANETLTVQVLSGLDPSISVVDANGDPLSGPQERVASRVDSVRYLNGATARDVFLSISTIGLDRQERDRYRLTLIRR